MKNLTIKNLTEVCSGIYHGPENIMDREVSSITTDSRKIPDVNNTEQPPETGSFEKQADEITKAADKMKNSIMETLDVSEEDLQKAMEILGSDTGNSIFIGDQLLTDVYGAKRAGIRNILVKPINPKEEIQIVLKRYLEKIVLHFYKKEEGIS